MFSQNSHRINPNGETSPKKEKEVVYHSNRKHKPLVKQSSNVLIEETKDSGNPGVTTKRMNLTVVQAGNKKLMNSNTMDDVDKLIAEEFKMQEGYKIIEEEEVPVD